MRPNYGLLGKLRDYRGKNAVRERKITQERIGSAGEKMKSKCRGNGEERQRSIGRQQRGIHRAVRTQRTWTGFYAAAMRGIESACFDWDSAPMVKGHSR